MDTDTTYRATGAEFGRISDAMEAATDAWVAAGHPLDGPVADAREAVFMELRRWNTARAAGQW